MIIGIMGFAGSGKGTIADILVKRYMFQKVSFADPLKDSVAAVFGWPRHLLEGETKESREFRETPDPFWSERFGKETTPREIMQLMGTQAGRDVFDKNLWIFSLEKRLRSGMNYVIPDVRFPNEIDYITKSGGHMIRVQRGENPDWYDTALAANSDTYVHADAAIKSMNDLGVHYSEWAWIGSPVSYHINNNSSISMLESDVSHMLKVLTGKSQD